MNFSPFIDHISTIKATLEALSTPDLMHSIKMAGAKQLESEMSELLGNYRKFLVAEGVRKKKGRTLKVEEPGVDVGGNTQTESPAQEIKVRVRKE